MQNLRNSGGLVTINKANIGQDSLNGANVNRPVLQTTPTNEGLKGNVTMIMENPGLDDDSDSDSEGGGGAGRLSKGPVIGGQHAQLSQGQDGAPTGLKPGKKTKGRVKIKMEFIENKLRRYTTFSKRKTGIMKKVNKL